MFRGLKHNRKRGNNFEEEYLISDVSEHLSEPYDVSILDFIKEIVSFGQAFYKNEGFYPSVDDFVEYLSEGEKTIAEIKGAEYLSDLVEFFTSRRPEEISELNFETLKYRWGFLDFKVHRIKHSSSKFNTDAKEIVQLENELTKKMGFRIKQNKKTFDGWLKK